MGIKIEFNGGTPFDISKDNFRHLRIDASRKNIAFVDGGETMLKSDTVSAKYYIRAFALMMRCEETVKSLSYESLVKIDAVTGGVSTDVDGLEHMTLELESATGSVRKIMELRLAEKMVSHMEQGDVLLLDGTLEARNKYEKEAFDSLKAAAGNKVLIAALAKSCTLRTKSGESALDAISAIAPDSAWYIPAGTSANPMHDANIYFSRLHMASQHILRLELSRSQEQIDVGKVIGFIAHGSRDLILPGYPWGLIKADMLARVSNREQEYLRLRNQLEHKTIHDVLDSMG